MFTLHTVRLLHLCSVCFMAGVIWLVQAVEYPLFMYIDPARFVAFHRLHSSRITWVVGPAMMTQLVTAGMLVYLRPGFLTVTLLGLTLGVFSLTAWVSVPLHEALGGGYDPSLCRQLVSTNWWRTATWSMHALLAVLACALWPNIDAI